MEDWKKYLHQPKPVTQLLNDSIIVIDTNVLLAAYQWREVTVNEVLNALQKIKDENRLRIPLQVIKEFSRNRPHEIQQRMNDLDTLISKLQKEKPLIERVPMLEGKDSLKEIEELRENYNKAIKDYKDGLINLRDHLKELFYKDQFLDKIMELAEDTILLPEQTEQNLQKEAKERFKLKIPPGFKDSSKEENSAGDFIVWSSILQLKSNVVFVSGDKKPDWVYQDSK
ncbi:PIN-like domain-containing protein [Bacillus subtilis]|nr:PIN-like domain-containing protein [Bacillus subtilis]WFA93909.1 PIN domain-containing protein [Bacillus subtilis]